MKKLLPFFLLLFSFSTFATTAKVDSAICGEIDPFLVGDACIVRVIPIPKINYGPMT